MSAEDLERYEADIELQLYHEYRDVLSMFQYVVETERRFYLCNKFDLEDGRHRDPGRRGGDHRRPARLGAGRGRPLTIAAPQARPGTARAAGRGRPP